MAMIERITVILDVFDDRTSRLTLEEISRRSQLPRSTVHRILKQLVRLHWVEHTPFGYTIGRRALRMGGISEGYSAIRAAAAPVLQDLHRQTGMVVHLAVLEGGENVYLDKVGGRDASTLPSRIGGRGPAYATACGKSMLAYLAPEWVDGLYGQRLHRCTERTIGEITALHRELNLVRRRGIAFDWSEAFRGLACAGAAIRGTRGPLAALSVCGPADTAPFERAAPLVAAAAREIALTLGRRPAQVTAPAPRRSRDDETIHLYEDRRSTSCPDPSPAPAR
ncbi:IclR family transcriptional regulator [Nocardia carnea]|uniref:IclR family transcriptional regulator n=1 Tax=Nocardia carnea TaxID=37328 RepID=A0ABW7TIA2_9NOCA|nr:IclR family transcriptional regulator [Nocardia carnea]